MNSLPGSIIILSGHFNFREYIFSKDFATSEDSFEVKGSASLYREATSITTKAYLKCLSSHCIVWEKKQICLMNFVWFVNSPVRSRNISRRRQINLPQSLLLSATLSLHSLKPPAASANFEKAEYPFPISAW